MWISPPNVLQLQLLKPLGNTYESMSEGQGWCDRDKMRKSQHNSVIWKSLLWPVGAQFHWECSRCFLELLVWRMETCFLPVVKVFPELGCGEGVWGAEETALILPYFWAELQKTSDFPLLQLLRRLWGRTPTDKGMLIPVFNKCWIPANFQAHCLALEIECWIRP